jgi:hypothetical protein
MSRIVNKAAKGDLSHRAGGVGERRRHGEPTAAPDSIGPNQTIGTQHLARLGAHLYLAFGLSYVFDTR